MASMTSITTRKVQNRRLDNIEFPDTSTQKFHVIIYYPGTGNDPGKKYNIVRVEELEDTWDLLEKGVEVSMMVGSIRAQGIVVSVSDDLEYLKNNLKSILTEKREKIRVLSTDYYKPKRKRRFHEHPKREILKIIDKETQTEQQPLEFQNNETTHVTAAHFNDLEKEYEELKSKLHAFKAIFSEVRTGIDAVVNLKKNNIHDESKQSVPSTSSNEDDNSGEDISSSVSNKERTDYSNQMIQIGNQGSKIPKNVYDSVNWSSYTAATRKLLMTLFSRTILATHSLTGKPSPAFLDSDKQKKMRLDPVIISDIMEIVSKKCKVSESLVRKAITTKCADENKLYRKRVENQKESETEEKAYGEE